MWLISAAIISWVGCLLPDSELFILFAKNSQILLNFCYSQSLNFHFSGSTTNSIHRPRQLIIAAHNCHKGLASIDWLENSRKEAPLGHYFASRGRICACCCIRGWYFMFSQEQINYKAGTDSPLHNRMDPVGWAVCLKRNQLLSHLLNQPG